MVKTYGKKDAKNIKLSANFRVGEFNCKCKRCSVTLIDDKLVEILQDIRNHFGASVHINSGYRCKEHNAEVANSSPTSRHMRGMAADIVVEGVDALDVARYAESAGVLGVGYYKEQGFCHIDTRDYKRFWLGHAGVEVETFGADKKTVSLDLPVLKKGAKGETVRALQQLLSAAGYTLDVDESFGGKTENALMSYQEDNGLVADGSCGKKTWSSLLGL